MLADICGEFFGSSIPVAKTSQNFSVNALPSRRSCGDTGLAMTTGVAPMRWPISSRRLASKPTSSSEGPIPPKAPVSAEVLGDRNGQPSSPSQTVSCPGCTRDSFAPAGILAIGPTVAGAELAGAAAARPAADPAEADPFEAGPAEVGPHAEISSSPAAARDIRTQARAGIIIWFSSVVSHLDPPWWLTNLLIIETAKGQMPLEEHAPQFRYSFANAISENEAKRLYEAYPVPGYGSCRYLSAYRRICMPSGSRNPLAQ